MLHCQAKISRSRCLDTMTEASQDLSATQSKWRPNQIAVQWLNPGTPRFWLVLLVLLYTLAGFFLMPYLVKKGIVDFIQEKLGREIRIDSVEFNPYVLSLTITGLSVDDTDGIKLAGIGEFFVNFQLSSVFYRAWTFDEIRLDGLYFYLHRIDAENSRLGHLIDDLTSPQTAPEPTDESDGLPRLLVRDLRLRGAVDIRDDVPAPPVNLQLNPIDIAVTELNTLPDKTGRQAVSIQLPDGLMLRWEGSLDLAPFESAGQLVLDKAQLAHGLPYVQATLPLDSLAATLSSRFDYRVFSGEDGVMEVEIDNLDLKLDDVSLTGLSPRTEFLALEALNLKGGMLRYPGQSLRFQNLHIEGPRISAWLQPDGEINFADLAPAPSAPSQAAPDDPETEPTGNDTEDVRGNNNTEGKDAVTVAGKDQSENTEAKAPQPGWSIGIDQISLAKGAVNFSDHRFEPPARLDLTDLNVELGQFNTGAGARMPLSLVGRLEERGQVTVDGAISLSPAPALALQVRATDLPLNMAQTHIQEYLRIVIERGSLNTDLTITLPANEALNIAGSLQVASLDVRDADHKNTLLAWEDLSLNRLELDMAANTLNISRLEFQKPYARFAVHEDLSTNVSGLWVKPADQPSRTATQPVVTQTPEAPSPLKVVIGGIHIDDASLDFSDLSLPLPFATQVHSLSGSVSTIASANNTPSKINLEGQVDKYGLARIDGDINLLDPLLDTEVSVEFRNLNLPSLSPYSGKFAGRKISDGKLGLDLNYRIDKGVLKASNDIVLSNLRLGEKIDSPNAVSLPLDLAIALLKDADGVIKANIPITGDVNDPRFALGGIIRDAIFGLITDVASAPFRFLGHILGVTTADLGHIQFLPGRADLTPPELEKIGQLEFALNQRPQLALKISGAYDPETDAPALQFIALRNQLSERQGERLNPDNKTSLLASEYRDLLEALFTDQFPDTSLKSLKAIHTTAGAEDPKTPGFDDLAYATELRDRLLAAQIVGELELKQLAQARAEAIRAAVLDSGTIEHARILPSQPRRVKSEGGEWVTLTLDVAP